MHHLKRQRRQKFANATRKKSYTNFKALEIRKDHMQRSGEYFLNNKRITNINTYE